MKLSVSSGNSLDTLYLSMDGVLAQLPGLLMKRSNGKALKRRGDRRREKMVSRGREKHERKTSLSTVGGMSNFSGQSSDRKTLLA